MNKRLISYIIGMICGIEGMFFLVDSLYALIIRENTALVYFGCAVVCLLIGYFAQTHRPSSDEFYAKDGFITVSLSWTVMSIIGAIPFVLTGEIPSVVDALFEVVSGFTTTGSTILTNVEVLSRSNLLWRSFTHWIGGMGVLVFVLAILPLSGNAMHIMKAESPGPSVGKLVSKLSQTAKILYLIYILITIVEFVVLLMIGVPAFDAITTTFGTAGTGGFGILNDSITSYSLAIRNTVSIFMILFGVNFNVYYLLFIKHFKDAFKCEEMWWYFGIIAVAVLLITFNIRPMYDSFANGFFDALFQVASIITTTGFSTADFNLWPTFSQTVLVACMFIGACAGSTGGGLKVSRFVIALKDARSSLREYVRPRSVKTIRFEHKPVTKEISSSIRIYLVMYFMIMAGSVLLISLDNFSFTTNFTAVVATLNNIGPGLEIVGPTGNFSMFSNFSKFILMFDMLAGRLELIPMMLLFSPASYIKK